MTRAFFRPGRARSRYDTRKRRQEELIRQDQEHEATEL